MFKNRGVQLDKYVFVLYLCLYDFEMRVPVSAGILFILYVQSKNNSEIRRNLIWQLVT